MYVSQRRGTAPELCNERYSSTSIYAHYNWDFKCLSAARSDRYGFDAIGFVSALHIKIYIYIPIFPGGGEVCGPFPILAEHLMDFCAQDAIYKMCLEFRSSVMTGVVASCVVSCARSPCIFFYPRCSMYGIFTYIWPKDMVNVGKKAIHWESGYVLVSKMFYFYWFCESVTKIKRQSSSMSKSRWWFLICIFTPTWGRFPMWLVLFKWVGSTTN